MWPQYPVETGVLYTIIDYIAQQLLQELRSEFDGLLLLAWIYDSVVTGVTANPLWEEEPAKKMSNLKYKCGVS